jgi:phosphate-selective porin OprO and OprP
MALRKLDARPDGWKPCDAAMVNFKTCARSFKQWGAAAPLFLLCVCTNARSDVLSYFSDPTPQWVWSDSTLIQPILSYDFIKTDFSNDHGKFSNNEKGQFNRIGFTVLKPGVYEVVVYYSLLAKSWREVYVTLQTPAFTSYPFGTVRLGEGKVPLDFDKATSSTQTSFIEYSSASQAIVESYRVGALWSLHREHVLLDAGYFGDNLEGSNPGHTWSVHGAWVPFDLPGKVLHLGAARTMEYPEGRTDELGLPGPATASYKAMPSVLLNDVSLISSGTLYHVKSIQRSGLEALWINGPFSWQAGYLGARTSFSTTQPHYDINGRYTFASWVLTGESRQYGDGIVHNVIPVHPEGAFELVLRYSSVDLNDLPVSGGWERDWTAGLNWYYGTHLRLQLNYTHTVAHREQLWLDPRTLELRLELFI